MKDLFRILLCCFMSYLLTSHNSLLAQWIQTNGPSGGSVASLAVSGTNIIAAVGPGQGIFLSTDNAKSWSKVKSIFPEYNYVTSVAAIGSKTFAGMGDGLYVSEDNGMNWSNLNSGPAYAIAFASTGTRLFSAGVGFYYSIDNGITWNELKNAPAPYTPVNTLAVIGTKIFTGTDAVPQNSGIYLSTDDGQSWIPVNNGLSNKMVTSFAVIDSSLFAGTRGGVFLSTDYGASWNSVSAGLGNTTVTSLAVNGKHLFAGTANGIFLSTDKGVSWNKASSGIPEHAVIQTFAVKGTDIFAGTKYLQGIDGGGLYLSTNYGMSWTPANNGIVNTSVKCIAFSGNNIFAGTYAGLFRSSDDGKSWKFLKNGLEYNSISTLAVSGEYIFAGTDSNGVFRSNDNGTSWNSVNTGLKYLTIYSLFVHGTDLFAGARGGGTFRSKDNGDSWMQLNNFWVNSFTANSKYIFAGTGTGVTRSSDNGENWKWTGSTESEYLNSLAAVGEVIFAGHDMGYGAIRSTDNGDSWNMVQGGFIASLAASGTNLFIGTPYGVILYEESTGTAKEVGEGFPDLYTFEVLSLAASGTELYAGIWNYGVWKRPLSEMITLTPAPGIPQLISVTNNSKDQPLDLNLSWNKSSSAETYHLMVSSDSMFKDVVLSDSVLTDTLKEVKGLKEGLKYYWKVCSKNSAGRSPFSGVWNFTTVLNAPEDLGASVQNNKNVRLTWKDKSDNETGYVIERKQSTDFTSIDTLKADVTGCTDSTVSQGSAYQYRVKAYTPFASSAYSNIVSISITEVSNKKMIPAEYSLFQNYPNPFNPVTIIKYTLPVKSFVELKISDMLGREVFVLVSNEQDTGDYNIKFDGSFLPSGIYIYTIQAGNFRACRKFLLLK